jgi:uncharacterized protein
MMLMVMESQDGDDLNLKIRPYHLICIQGFQGYCYSREFNLNLASIIEEIRTFSEFNIKIATGVDCICESCPYNIEVYVRSNLVRIGS